MIRTLQEAAQDSQLHLKLIHNKAIVHSPRSEPDNDSRFVMKRTAEYSRQKKE